MKKGYVIAFLLIFLIAIPFVSATIYKQGTEIDLKVPAINLSGAFYSASASCNITAYYQNGSVIINGKNMSKTGTYFNYTLTSNQTQEIGEHTFFVVCQDIAYEYRTSTLEITQTGKTASSSVSGWVIFGIILTLFIISMALFILGGNVSPSNPQARVIIRGIFIAGGLLFLLVTLYTLNITAEEYIQMPAITSLLNRLITISSILIPAVFFFIIIAQLKMAADEIKETARGY